MKLFGLNISITREEKSSDLSSVPYVLMPTGQQLSSSGQQTYETLVSAYKSWVYIAIDKIAKTVASTPLRIYTYKRNGKYLSGREIKSAFSRDAVGSSKRALWCKSNKIERELVEQHPVYDLLARPNTIQTRYQLWYDTVVKLQVGGQCGWYIPTNGAGIPVEIWPLPLRATGALSCRVGDKGIFGYRYEDGTVKQTFDLDEIIMFMYQSPKNFYKPFSPLMAQTGPYDIDNYLTDFLYYMFKNRATPGNVLSTDQNLTKAQLDSLISAIKEQFSGTTRAGRPMILHSGLKAGGQVTVPLKDLILDNIGRDVQEKLLSAYGCPAGKVGIVRDVNRANMEALDKTFTNETIYPLCMLVEEQIERDLLPRFDDRLTADFDLPEFSERELDLRERDANIKNGYTTINEERAKEGLPEVPWGDIPWMPVSMIQVGESSSRGSEPVEEEGKSFHIEEKKEGEYISLEFDFDDPNVQKRLGDRLEKFSKSVTKTTYDEVSSILREGFSEGLGLPEIADRIRTTFKQFRSYRADNISRTESTYSVSTADLEVIEQNKLQDRVLKYWISSRDENTRETHYLAEVSYAEGIPIDAGFAVGADVMDAPGMGSVAEENCNCRCSLGFRPKETKSWTYNKSWWANKAKAAENWNKAYTKLFRRSAIKMFNEQEKEVLDILDSEGAKLKAKTNGWSLSKIRIHLKQIQAVSEMLPTQKEWEEKCKDIFEPTYSWVIAHAADHRIESMKG